MPPKVFFRLDGTACRYPVTRVDATTLNILIYDSGEKCPECVKRGDTTYARFTHNAECIHCCRLRSIKVYQNVVDGITYGARSAEMAALMGLKEYYRPEMCDKAGHIGKRTTTGVCVVCDSPTPRQLAIEKNEKWYTPTTPCKNGHLSSRAVHDGKCKDCEAMAPKQRLLVQDTYPELVVNRQVAASMNWKVFRTGIPCRRGHSAYRYVSTGGCLKCKEDKSKCKSKKY